jgi:hypothetical protein
MLPKLRVNALDVMGFNEGARHFYSGQGFSELGYRMYSDEPIAYRDRDIKL